MLPKQQITAVRRNRRPPGSAPIGAAVGQWSGQRPTGCVESGVSAPTYGHRHRDGPPATGRGVSTVKCAIMLFRNPAPGERPDEWRELIDPGELVQDVTLADPVMARTVRLRDGVPTVSHAPHQQPGHGDVTRYFVVDCENMERAVEIAGRVLAASSGWYVAVEIRPIMMSSGQEM